MDGAAEQSRLQDDQPVAPNLKHQVRAVIYECPKSTSIYSRLEGHFDLLSATSHEQLIEFAQKPDIKLVILNVDADGSDGINLCKTLKQSPATENIPIVLFGFRPNIKAKVEAFENGIDDYIDIDATVDMDEVDARLMKAVFNKIANDQLLNRLSEANELAFIAMSGSSDLGINIRFFLDSMDVDNVDELAMLFFNAANDYGIHCSLQIRSKFEIKNVEANGLAKDLESSLLSELKDVGRYYDFGRRTVVNYGNVSLLIKDMPLEDEKKYGAIKDNSFFLLQGLAARVQALDAEREFQQEHELLEKLTARIQSVVLDTDENYHEIMRRIANVVEDMAEKIYSSLNFLGLSEEQEKVIEQYLQEGIQSTESIFSDGFRIDGGFKEMVSKMNQLLSANRQNISPADREELLRQLSS